MRSGGGCRLRRWKEFDCVNVLLPEEAGTPGSGQTTSTTI